MRNKCTGLHLARVAILAAALGAFAGGQAAAGTIVYVAGSGNEFGTLDLSTGAFTLSGEFPPTTGRNGLFPIFGLGFTGQGQLSAVDAKGKVFAVNPTNGTRTFRFSSGTFPNGGGGDGHGDLHVFDSGTSNVDALNVKTGSVTPVAMFSAGFGSTGFTAVGPDGSVYITGSAPNGISEDIYRINPQTGSVTDLGPDGAPRQLDAGVFVGSTLSGFSITGSIFTVDTTTGAATHVGSYSNLNGSLNDSIFAAAFQVQSAPEPSSLVRQGCGAAGIAGVVHRGRGRPQA